MPIRPPSIPTKSEWPPNYVGIWQWRQHQLLAMRDNPRLLVGAKEYYRTRPVEFITHWMDTYDPRNAGREAPARMPFVLFERQAEFIHFLQEMVRGPENGLVEKARDMGATWASCAFSVWLWLFQEGAAIGWGSRKADLVDKIGDPDSIFEKLRMLLNGLPREFRPAGIIPERHLTYMKMVNPTNGSTITGESGDNIGRGGRKLIYFKDESAHYERPEKIEAALADNTNVQIDISSVNGLGNVFHRRREAGAEWQPGMPAIKGRTNVFIMDWRDHPAKDQQWYDTRKAKAEEEGLLHLFAQEVDRNYAASVTGVVIPLDWIRSATGAHIKLGWEEGAMGNRPFAALDVADEGGDKNALAVRRGIYLSRIEDWGEGDTGQTTHRAIEACRGLGRVELQYDVIGVGSGVKSEANRLKREGLLPPNIVFVPWNAGAGVVNPDEPLEDKDPNDPDDVEQITNREFYANLKAQGWWQLRRRFEKTHRAVTEGIEYPIDELISLDPSLSHLRQLEKELAQVTASRTTANLKLVIDKNPPGTQSPNLADAVMMAYWPMTPVSVESQELMF